MDGGPPALVVLDEEADVPVGDDNVAFGKGGLYIPDAEQLSASGGGPVREVDEGYELVQEDLLRLEEAAERVLVR